MRHYRLSEKQRGRLRQRLRHVLERQTRLALDSEETLAYIRRGRLERAAQCLPHCDHVRLLALLHMEDHRTT